MPDIYRIITADDEHIEAMVNEASEKYQVLSFTVLAISNRVMVTCVMVDKRELPRPVAGISLPGNARPPFGS